MKAGNVPVMIIIALRQWKSTTTPELTTVIIVLCAILPAVNVLTIGTTWVALKEHVKLIAIPTIRRVTVLWYRVLPMMTVKINIILFPLVKQYPVTPPNVLHHLRH